MIALDGTPVLTVAQMRAAEETAFAAGTRPMALMRQAGAAVAVAVGRLAGANEILVLCGPGNNGGDGYVAAARLAAMGKKVRVAALADPSSEQALEARAGWAGPIEPLADARPAPVVVDALFGIGLSRPLADEHLAALRRLVAAAMLSIAVDVPSGVGTDDGTVPGDLPRFDVTLALGAAKPAHVLQPAAAYAGEVRLLPLAIDVGSDVSILSAPQLSPPAVDAHKFSRGMVAVVRGRMTGAAQLAAEAAMHAGAGYVALLGATIPEAPHALVRRRFDPAALSDSRIGALVVGPGLGRDDAIREVLAATLATDWPLVVDGDALHLVSAEVIAARRAMTILTPHAGEFAAMFGAVEGSKLAATRAAARRSGAVVVHKGPDTVIAAPDGRIICAMAASSWLSTAGSGDVLAGAIAAMLAGGRDAIDAAAAGVWLHAAAAQYLRGPFIADDLARALAAVRA